MSTSDYASRAATGCMLVLALTVIAAEGCDDESSSSSPREEAPPKPLSALFASGEVGFVGPLEGLRLGMTVEDVADLNEGLVQPRPFATHDYGGAQFVVLYGRDQRVRGATVEIPSQAIREAARAGWGPPTLERGETYVWGVPDAGLLVEARPPTYAGGFATLRYREYTPLESLLGVGDAFGALGLRLLGASYGELSEGVDLSGVGEEQRDLTATFRIPETELRDRAGQILVTVQLSGAGRDAVVVGYTLKLKAEDDLGRDAILGMARALHGPGRPGPDRAHVFVESPLVALEREESGWRLRVERRKALSSILPSRVGLFGPAEPLTFGLSEADARAASPELFSSPGGYRPPAMERFQFKARFGRGKRLSDVFVYGPYLEVMHTLRKTWGDPVVTGEDGPEKRLWWLDASTRIRCMVQEGVGGAQMELDRYLPIGDIVELAESGSLSDIRTLEADASEVRAAFGVWVDDASPKKLDITLPPVHTRLSSTPLRLVVRNGRVQRAELTIAYGAQKAIRDELMATMSSDIGEPARARDRLGRTSSTWGERVSVLDDEELGTLSLTIVAK